MAGKEVDTVKHRMYQACCDIYEDKGNVILKMEMPGVTKENLDIKIDNNILMIHGRKERTDADKTHYLLREIKDGDYYHEYSVDDTIDKNKIDATLDKGVVTLTLSIKESEKPRKITVVSG